MKHIKSVNKFVPVLILLLSMFIGCTLDREGLRPSTICKLIQTKHEVNPVSHKYSLQGFCHIGGHFTTFDIEAEWHKGRIPAESEAKAIVKLLYQGQELTAEVRANCPDGDPLIYDVNCQSRQITGNLTQSALWPYYVDAFRNHLMPAIFTETQKAALRAEAEWPKTPPIFLYPPPQKIYVYQDPKKVLIFIKLPFSKGYLSSWQLHFQYEKWLHAPTGQGGRWGTPVYKRIDKLYKSSGGDYVGRKSLSLDPGSYRIRAWAEYADLWNSNTVNPPVAFGVKGVVKKPKSKQKTVIMKKN